MLKGTGDRDSGAALIDEPVVHALCFSGEEGTFPTRIKEISPRGAFIGSVAQLFGFWHNYSKAGTYIDIPAQLSGNRHNKYAYINILDFLV
jgi:hypothetical protein